MIVNSSSTRRLGSGLRQLIPTGRSDHDVVVAVEKVIVSSALVDVAAVLLSRLGSGVTEDPVLRDLAENVASALRATLETQAAKSRDV